jgi:predicted CoA-binding protein
MNRAEDIEAILKMRVIAVVGCSGNPERASHQVASYLQGAGYRVIPVHPKYSEVIGVKCYPSLSDIREPVDAVVIFRRSEYIMPIVEAAVRINAKAVWMQDGVGNDAAAELARRSGLRVVMDDCIMRRHLSRLGG